MNYHFDAKTLPQLIHLLKDQPLDLKDVDWRPAESELWLRLQREAPPNEGKYRIRIREVKDFRIHPEGGLKEARTERLERDGGEGGFSLSGAGFRAVIRVNRYAVSALGETEKLPGPVQENP